MSLRVVSRFQSKCGQENCIVLRHTRQAELAPCAHTLSIRAAWGGTEHCQVGGRVIGVDDDNFLILNDGRVFATSIRSRRPVESLAICFRPSLVEQAVAAMDASLDQALRDGGLRSAPPPEFIENLQPHDKLVSPVLRFIKEHVLQDVEDAVWYEEQLHFLLERMLAHRGSLIARMEALQLSRSVTRREVFRRIGQSVDYLHTNYARPVTLDELASVACLSKYHFLRLFALVHGMTPISYLQRKRAAVALRLLRTTQLTASEVASCVGWLSRATVMIQIRRWTGLRPHQLRGDNRAGALLDRVADEELACAS